MKVQGSCHCGSVTYEAEIDPAKVGMCNCTDCQMLTGSAFRVNVPVQREDLQLKGKLTIYTKTAESGTKRRHAFCPTCGSPVYATADTDEPTAYTLRIGCIRQKAMLPPQRQIWRKSALEWAQDLHQVPALEKG